MIPVPADVLNELAQRRGVTARALYWFTGRNRSTGLPESLGLWTGADAVTVTVEGDPRTYYGPVVVEGGAVRSVVGGIVPSVRLALAGIAAEVQTALRVYDPRGATVEIHAVLFNPVTGVQIATPFLRFLGRIDEILWTVGAIDDAGRATSTVELTIVPQAERLMVTKPWFRSDADQQAIYPGDKGFEYVATAAQAEVVVGAAKVRPPPGGVNIGADGWQVGGFVVGPVPSGGFT
jgi:hypothetical protein